jgi:peptidoglycan/xylan/chitin deacetylase (PgdA/CDA1 family)/CelD/BcsL family acetyltransferase involved in cellulose biosynthesis
MRVVEFRTEEDLQKLRSDWTTLLRMSASDTIFLTWEWATAWWSAYGVPGELCILAAFDESGQLGGLAPMRTGKLRRFGQTVSSLSFIGDGSNDSDYLDFITVSGREPEVMQAFCAHLGGELDRGTVLRLNEIPATSPNLPQLKNLADSNGLFWSENEIPCGTVRLPPSWEEYLAMLKPRFRTKARSVLRRLEDCQEARFDFCDRQEQLNRLLPALFDLHTRRWAEDGKPGVFGSDQKRRFYDLLSSSLLERGWLKFSWLQFKGRIIACQYGFTYSGVYSQLQEGYEPASEHWNTGIGLRAWTIRKFLEAGIREYDFLGGMGRHKSDWGAETKYGKNVVVARERHNNRFFLRGPRWESRARELLNQLAPEKLLTARRTFLQQRANGRIDAKPGRDRMRQAIANCYFRLNMTGLVGRVRSQYRLSTHPHRMWPKWSLEKRNKATGRILYYHRVNNDNDPFFPSIPTDLFEHEMRFVARHYRVVGLSELLDRLESDTPRQWMAITFDDGYQDNYQLALPILERYGLPATVFLTTGVIDSREPLWFEQLALALKKTSREFIELEFDIPRRFRTGTEAERLDANNKIISLLRGLPDSERREWLAEILRQLGVRDGERHGKMLTWEEIRSMKARRIDFGGHTVTHPYISKLGSEQIAWEATECKRRIEEELQTPVEHFAYPNGREEDFGHANKDLIRRAGYRAAFTTIWGPNHRSTDRMELRRGGPWENSPAMFAYKLDWYELMDA